MTGNRQPTRIVAPDGNQAESVSNHNDNIHRRACQLNHDRKRPLNHNPTRDGGPPLDGIAERSRQAVAQRRWEILHDDPDKAHQGTGFHAGKSPLVCSVANFLRQHSPESEQDTCGSDAQEAPGKPVARLNNHDKTACNEPADINETRRNGEGSETASGTAETGNNEATGDTKSGPTFPFFAPHHNKAKHKKQAPRDRRKQKQANRQQARAERQQARKQHRSERKEQLGKIWHRRSHSKKPAAVKTNKHRSKRTSPAEGMQRQQISPEPGFRPQSLQLPPEHRVTIYPGTTAGATNTDQHSRLVVPEPIQEKATIRCVHCRDIMLPTTRIERDILLQILGVFVFAFGVLLLFLVPLGTLFGIVLIGGSLRLGHTKTKVWRCHNCGFFYERMD